jgi:hypothetical protein
LLGCVRIEGVRKFVGVDKMGADMVFDHFGHKTGECSACPSDKMEDLVASGLPIECAFDGFNLAFDPTNAGQELLFFMNGV